MIWIVCEILPDCSNETSCAGGINFFGVSINTNLYDDIPEGVGGFLMLGISFTLMAFLAVWRIKLKTIYKTLILCLVFAIPISISMWVEYGVVCNDNVVDHLQKHSNLFDDDYEGEFAMNDIGYPFGVHELNIQECVDYVLEQRASDRK